MSLQNEASLFRCALDVGLRLLPRLGGDDLPDHATDKVASLKMNAAVAPRNSGLLGGFGKSRPLQRNRRSRNGARLDL